VFSQSTGLDVNYQKSFIIPINVDSAVMKDLATAFGCKIGTMPFTYLGLPVGTKRPKMVDFMPLVDCMERRMTASSSFLNQGERLQFLNSVYPLYQFSLWVVLLSQLVFSSSWKEFKDSACGESIEMSLPHLWLLGNSYAGQKTKEVLVFLIWGFRMWLSFSSMPVIS